MSHYPFSNLTPERFQEFCQALILKEYPHLQCFPVGMPDGGRDAVSRVDNRSASEFVVFQVKFVRDDEKELDLCSWLKQTLDKEKEKITKLIARGANKYILITNIPGTSHLDVGSIDKIQGILNSTIPISSMCLWQEDLNRRLENAWDLKWSYPELMTGIDLIRGIVETGLNEDKERRACAIKAFVRDQYEAELEVKFKQVELQNKLFDLFIDVPLVPYQKELSRKQWIEISYMYRLIANTATQPIVQDRDEQLWDIEFDRPSNKTIGAAEFFLHSSINGKFNQVVLEGAPGQGKSTITQYICQAHRIKVLGIEQIPALKLNVSSAKLPIRIDLRDYADWISRKNPFSTSENEQVPSHWHKSLETFLAALILNNSGGQSFSPADLIAVSKVSSLLLVFDGLDEVADIELRRELVCELTKGINRIKENAISIQVIVTTRPAAIADVSSIKFDGFIHVQLQFLNRQQIEEYAEKWFKAKRIDSKERSEIRNTLKDKLNQSHLRELARNTMQLAILLSLIHSRGSSLPDKRTALYDQYVDLFFSRESEKSETVRNHRDLLIQIHQYLAWILHTETEKGNNLGSITGQRLREVVSQYLIDEGHDTTLVDQLFNGIVERVVALVSRVEGRYEFEVQPLREYFVAKYLYETAPYSPPGQECTGTKPDRFDGISRNPYWLNVTRFYAGCFSKGELLSLIDRLEELCKSPDYVYITYPRELAITLLSDWVFIQHPKSVSKVVSLILDEVGLKIILSRNFNQRHVEYILPKKCGAEELIKHCFELLSREQAVDYEIGLIDLIKSNSEVGERRVHWNALVANSSLERRLHYLHIGVLLEIIPRMTSDEISVLISDNPNKSDYIDLLLYANKRSLVESDKEKFCIAINLILDGGTRRFIKQRDSQSITEVLSAILTKSYLTLAHQENGLTLSSLSERTPGNRVFVPEQLYCDIRDVDVKNTLRFIRLASELENSTCEAWSTTLEPWNNLVELGRSIWGERLSFYELANQAAGIKSNIETHTEATNLFDNSIPLCSRARYARLRAGQPQYWLRHLALARPNSMESIFLILLLISWGSSRSIEKIAIELDEKINDLDEHNWNLLVRSARFSQRFSELTSQQPINVSNLPSSLSQRCASMLCLRNKAPIGKIYQIYLQKYDGDDPVILEFCQMGAVILFRKELNITKLMELVRHTYRKGVVNDRMLFHRLLPRIFSGIDIDQSEKILERANEYPSYLVAIASSKIQNRTMQNVRPVLDVATEESWFNS